MLYEITMDDVAQKLASLRPQGRRRLDVRRPSYYTIAFLDDDLTPPEFIFAVLTERFRLDTERAHRHMLERKEHGVTCVGRFSREVAEMKHGEVVSAAHKADVPLRVRIDPIGTC